MNETQFNEMKRNCAKAVARVRGITDPYDHYLKVIENEIDQVFSTLLENGFNVFPVDDVSALDQTIQRLESENKKLDETLKNLKKESEKTK